VLINDTYEALVPMPPTVVVSKALMGVLAMLEAHGMTSLATTMVSKAQMGVFTGLVLVLIKSMTVGSCTQHSCRIRQHGATE
jgi:hypothetical protein